MSLQFIRCSKLCYHFLSLRLTLQNDTPRHFAWLAEQFVWIDAGVFGIYKTLLCLATTFCVFI